MTGTPQIGFTLFGLQAGDIVVADRGYCRRGQLAYALRSATQVVVRLAVHQVPLLDERGEPFDVLAWLKALGSGHHCCFVAFEHEGRRFAGRLIASSLPEEAAERARAKERQKAEKQASNVSSKRRPSSCVAGCCSSARCRPASGLMSRCWPSIALDGR